MIGEAARGDNEDDAQHHEASGRTAAAQDGRGLARASGAGERSASSGEGSQQDDGHATDALVPEEQLELPSQSPLFHAEHSERYDRQRLILRYENAFNCRLVVIKDAIFPYAINVFEDLIFDADPKQDLHLLISTPGGDGETAVRLARSAQSRCRELTVIVPDQAKSAGTLLAMGANHILMGPSSDLGPVDPQFQLGPPGQQRLVSAKDIIAAVDAAETAIGQNPDSYPLHTALLGDVDALIVQQARSALERTGDLVEEALRSNPSRSEEEVAALREKIREPLIERPKSHAAIFGAHDAAAVGLPVAQCDPQCAQWQLLWRLWIKYFMLDVRAVYEGSTASKILAWGTT